MSYSNSIHIGNYVHTKPILLSVHIYEPPLHAYLYIHYLCTLRFESRLLNESANVQIFNNAIETFAIIFCSYFESVYGLT